LGIDLLTEDGGSGMVVIGFILVAITAVCCVQITSGVAKTKPGEGRYIPAHILGMSFFGFIFALIMKLTLGG